MNDLETAKNILAEGGYTCVLVKGGEFLTFNKSGVAPLLELLESAKDYSGFHAADRVAGKAAAMLYIKLGIKCVHAQLVSEPAAKAFADNGISLTYDTLVPFINNRTGNGLCPMEQAVVNISDPEQAHRTILELVYKMKQKHI